jgi:hypothetical protein
MKSTLARLLTRLYPRHWRIRYGAEFEAFLEMGRGDLRTLTNVVWSALSEHFFPLRGLKMNRVPRSLGAILCAYLAVIAAGINFYATIDDSDVATAMRSQLGLSTAWKVVALGSVVALMGAIAMFVPLVVGELRFALSANRRDILIRLLVAPLAAGILAAWVTGGLFVLGGHWAPAPWAIIGDWTAPADWPSLQVRWIFGSSTAALAVFLLIACSIGVYQAIQRTQFAEMRFTVLHRIVAIHPLRLARIPGMVTTAAMAVMTLGVLAWGLIANLQATAAFHTYSGPMHTTVFTSWTGSLFVFAVSSVVALRSSSSLRKPAGE